MMAANNQISGRISGFRSFIPSALRPAEYAAQLRREAGKNFVEEVDAHLLRGLVISTSEVFLMAKPVPKGVEIETVWDTWPEPQCNAWFVWIGVGVASRLLSFMPYPLPWLGWVRQSRGWARIHWIETAVLTRRLSSRQQLHSQAHPVIQCSTYGRKT